ncbi:MAG: LLM class flavin-dependent oxidoreductase [Bacteroidia bacterium]|nr:LLM class flavin-dependent oxidoreductase [Bacteroidia bacterium]
MKFSIFTVADHYPEKHRSIAQLYAEIEQQCILADELNFDSFFVAEHHFHEYGAIPNPSVFLSALAKKTSAIKLGPAISILPFHNPLTVAEDYAMLDVISNGRLILGVGSGYLKHEFEGFNISAEEKRNKFDENLQILKLALSGKRFSYKGNYFFADNIKLNVKPVQENVPVYVAVLRAEAAYHVGKRGQNIICVPYASVNTFDEVKILAADFRKGFKESGKKEKGETLFAFHTHIAETDEKAKQNAEEAFNLYADTRLYVKKQNYTDILNSGLALIGSVETVSKKITRLKEFGIDNVLLLMNFGMLENEKVKNSMKLFSEVFLQKR